MIKFYYSLAPNPMKVALFLEEAELPYEAIPVETRKGHQHSPEFRALNPNGKVPVIVDGEVVVFDSNAILLYLGAKTGRFLPPNTPVDRAQMISWMMFIASGVGPFSGQAVHFRHYAPEPVPYAEQRYDFEARRHFGVLDKHLAGREFMIADTYSIVDMALWGWARMMSFVMGDGAAAFGNVQRVVDSITGRPAAQRAIALKSRHSFKAEMDDEARRAMFGHLAPA